MAAPQIHIPCLTCTLSHTRSHPPFVTHTHAHTHTHTHAHTTTHTDPEATYNLVERADLASLAPEFAWDNYLGTIASPGNKFIVESPAALSSLMNLLTTIPAADWSLYLRWQIYSRVLPLLSSPFQDEYYAWRGELTGATAAPSRADMCLDYADAVLGFTLGRYFIEEAFSGSSRDQASDMIAGIRSAFETNVATLGWMSDATKAAAKTKEQMVTPMIGYPDFALTDDGLAAHYAGVTIDPTTFYANVRHGAAIESGAGSVLGGGI